MVCRTDLGLPGLPGFFVLPGPLRKVENVLHTYTVLDFIGESPYTRRVTDVAPCFEGGFWDSDSIWGKVGYDRDAVKGKIWWLTKRRRGGKMTRRWQPEDETAEQGGETLRAGVMSVAASAVGTCRRVLVAV
jgi:hypothetical protein